MQAVFDRPDALIAELARPAQSPNVSRVVSTDLASGDNGAGARRDRSAGVRSLWGSAPITITQLVPFVEELSLKRTSEQFAVRRSLWSVARAARCPTSRRASGAQQSLRTWLKQDQLDTGERRDGLTGSVRGSYVKAKGAWVVVQAIVRGRVAGSGGACRRRWTRRARW
ncbi:MAG: hypothetical protein M3P48_11550, partial [Actinomycetota bacterium]|nr:hypothetical protein [Actinomycetota bacterium]